jgi:hypothetical protein
MIKMNSNVVTEFPRSKKLIKYPRVAMSQNDESGTSGYVAGRSSNYQNNPATEAWKMFDGNLSTIWHSENSTGYWNTDGTYDGTSELITGYPGEYVTLQLPANEKVQLHGIRVFPRNLRSIGQSAGAAPKDVVVIGSNNGSSWNVIATTTLTNYSFGTNPSTSTPVGEEYVPATFDFEAMEHYQYVGLIIKTIYPGTHPHVHAAISTLEFLGVPEYDSEAHGTDVAVKSYPNVPNTDWLEIYYDGRETSSYPGSGTTVTDLSGKGVTGTLTAQGGFENVDNIKAFTSSGSTTHALTATTSLSGSPTMTISAWAKFDSFAPTSIIYLLGNSSVNNEMVWLGTQSNGSIWTLANGGVGAYNQYPNDTPVINSWIHVAAIYSGGTYPEGLSLYINGILLTPTVRNGSGVSLTLPSNSPLYLGFYNSGTEFFDGSIANFRLFNRALTSDEVWQLYAYQKEYFGHGDLGMTLKAGRLGIGTSEPRAMLDVRGIPHGPSSRPAWFRRRSGTAVTAGSIVPWNLMINENINCFNSTGDTYTIKVAGYYYMNVGYIFNVDRSSFYIRINDVNIGGLFLADDIPGGFVQVTGSLVHYLKVGDTVKVYINAGTMYGSDHNWFTGFHLGF